MSDARESDLRRRAAWLLGMLALVAVLFAALMVVFIGGDKKKSKSHLGDHPITVTSVSPHASSGRATSPSRSLAGGPSGSPSAPGTSGQSAPTTNTPTTGHRKPDSCPTSAPCALDGDIGNAIGAVNAYRVGHGKKPVPGSVTKAAQDCAVSNGSHCSGSWAESQVPAADGQAALAKVMSRAHDIESMPAFQVGWAYDPKGKQYFFAILQNG